MSILIAILVFGLLVFVHETGHFVAAKLCGITVYQFSIGFGPALLKKKIGDTLYAIRLFPFGGAVAMKGEIVEDESVLTEEDKKGSFLYAKVWQRMVVAFAGSFMNIVLGLVLLVAVLGGNADYYTDVRIDSVATNFAYPEYFQAGDEFVKINEFKQYIYNDMLTALELGQGRPYDITIRRDGELIRYEDITIEKRVYETDKAPRYGFQMTSTPFGSLFHKIEYAGKNAMSFLQSAFVSVKYLVTGQVKADQVMGTVGITSEISNRVKSSMADTWYFVAFLSINLAVVNLLPIFGLDGGKLMFLIWEAITRKPIKPKYEAVLNGIGLLLLLGLFVFVTYNDIAKLIA